MTRHLSALTISREPVEWLLPINHYNAVEPRISIGPIHAYPYVLALAHKRNIATHELLERFPQTTDILVCDSYYVTQIGALHQLLTDYNGKAVLGGAIWGLNIQRAKDLLFNRGMRWCDGWGCPDLKHYKYKDHRHRTDWQPVSSVSGVHIFPRKLWNQGVRYGAYEDTNKGCEMNYFMHQTRTPKYIDMAAHFFRRRVYSAWKCIRISVGLRARLGISGTRRHSGIPPRVLG